MKKLLSGFTLFLIVCSLNAQQTSENRTQKENDSTIAKINNFTAAVTIQSKGISTIPNLTLGKPAVAFDLKVGRKLAFEPQFRFAIEGGKPWAMVFWWRYYGSIGNKFRVILHANHSFAYKTITTIKDTSSGSSQEVIRTTRYLVGAISPNYQINKYIGVGMFLFFNWGLEDFITQNTYMVSFRPSISNIPITKNIVAGISPDIYYLKMDDNEGVYLTNRFSISKSNYPISISALITKTLNSSIPSEYDLLWKVELIYTFNRKYVEAR